MIKFPALFCASLSLIMLLCAITGCGGSAMNNGRVLQSLTITPASADAQNFPGGKVQFTVTGTFNMAPMTVPSPAVMWSMGSTQASVSSTGLAQCNGLVGSTFVAATAPTEPEIPLQGMTPSTPSVSAQATLICP